MRNVMHSSSAAKKSATLPPGSKKIDTSAELEPTIQKRNTVPTIKARPVPQGPLVSAKSLRQDRRTNLAIMGLSATIVASVAVFLLSNWVINGKTEPASILEENEVIQSEAIKSAVVKTEHSSSFPIGPQNINNPVVADNMAVGTSESSVATPKPAATVSSDTRIIDSYEEKLSTLQLENDEMQNVIALMRQESETLKQETLRLNEELLQLELNLAASNEAVNEPVEVQTVYNYVNLPIGGSSTTQGTESQDDSNYSQAESDYAQGDNPDAVDQEEYYDDDQQSGITLSPYVHQNDSAPLQVVPRPITR